MDQGLGHFHGINSGNHTLFVWKFYRGPFMDLNLAIIVLFDLDITTLGTMHGLLLVVLQNVYFIDLAAAGAGGSTDKSFSFHGRLPRVFTPLAANRSHEQCAK